MSYNLADSSNVASANPAVSSENNMFVTLSIADQLFGIPILQVRDILGPQKITPVPLAPPEVSGSLNLRGRIVTAIDVRTRLGLTRLEQSTDSMSIVVEHDNELYSLVVDRIGEVMSLQPDDYEKNPATMDARWQEIADGIYRLKSSLLVVLDVTRLLRLKDITAA